MLKVAAAIRKFGPVDMVANDSPRLRPVPRAPYTAATYGPIEQTCPDSCTFKAPGPNGVRPCFAGSGFTKQLVSSLEEDADGMTAIEIAQAEANVLDRAFSSVGGRVPQDGARGGRDLRLHVSGDAGSTAAARILASAADRWRARGGGTVWSYTHRWKKIPRSAWGSIAVLASVERPWDVLAARDRGYASAIVVAEHPTEKTWSPAQYPEVRIVPCPFETRGVTCGACRLCLDRDLHALGITIGFSMHGGGAKEGRRRLPVLQAAPSSAP